MKTYCGITAALVIATLVTIATMFAGCGLSDGTPPPAPSAGPTTPEQIRTAQTAVESVKADVSTAKQAAAKVASARQTVQVAESTVAAIPTEATTQKAQAQEQLRNAGTDLAGASGALDTSLTSAATHTEQAATALTSAQKSAQADAAAVAKVEQQLKKSQDKVNELKQADPARGWLEFAGVTCTISGIALAVAALLAGSIPLIGPFLQGLGTIAYEIAAALFGVGVLLITLAHYLATIELVIVWTGAGLAAIVLGLVIRRYWSRLSDLIVGTGTVSTTTHQPAPLP